MKAFVKFLILLTEGLLVTFDTLPVQGQSIVAQCYDNDTQTPICFATYKDREYALKSWTDARSLCSSSVFNGSLPVISTMETQFRLAEFLWDNGLTLDSIWLGAQGVSDGTNWKWVSGDTLAQSAQLDLSSVQFDRPVVVITTVNGNATLQDSIFSKAADGYICEFKNKPCPAEDHSHATSSGSCFVLYEESINWFSARNKCVYRNGDLAELSDPSPAGLDRTMMDLRLTGTQKKYWVGLRKMWWKWVSDLKEPYITYFKESADTDIKASASENCLTVDYKQLWAWSIRNCSINFHAVCLTSGPIDTKSSITITPATSTMDTVSLPAWAVGVICGAVGLFYILSLIVVGIIVWKCCLKKSSKNPKKKQGKEDKNKNKNNYVVDPVDGTRHQRRHVAPPREDNPGFDGEYPEGEFDDEYEDIAQTPTEYANTSQVRPQVPRR